MKKSDIRKKILRIRKTKNFKKIKTQSILKVLKKKSISGKILGGYYPYNYELDIMEILKNFEKKRFKISLPKIKVNSQMDFFPWMTEDPLVINKYGIPEPISNKIVFPDILLVPLVAFDDNLNRVGYGGGFYDRYIKKLRKKKNIITIGLAYSFQKVKQIQTNKHDVKLDFIVTEKEN